MRACWEIGLSRSAVRSPRRAMYSVPACLPTAFAVEEQELARVAACEERLRVGAADDQRHLRQAAPAAVTGAGEDQSADEVGVAEGDFLRHAAAKREAQQVDVLVAERADERNGVGGHHGDRVRHLAAGGADAPIVERDDVPSRGDAIDHAWVPVV